MVQEHSSCESQHQAQAPVGPLVGVIRWDHLYTSAPETNCELKSLSPLKWHYMAPDFLTIESDTRVTGCENDQAIIDQEITYAKNGGIDYWAFVTGPEMNPNGGEFYAMNKYRSSSRKSDISFSIIIHRYNSTPWSNRVAAMVSWFEEATYVKIDGNRPLVFIFSISDMETQYGAGAGTQQAIRELRNQTIQAGLGTPYIVAMDYDPTLAASWADTYGLDAISAYAYWGQNGGTYAEYRRHTAALWDSFINTGKPVIPQVPMGFNQGPRTENPPPWGGGGPPYWDYPTPYEAAMHIKAGLDYVSNLSIQCEANCILVYAWNEYCEGGWLHPTHSEGTARLDAIKAVKDGTLPVTTIVNDNTTGTGHNQFEYVGNWTYSQGTALDSRYRQDDHTSNDSTAYFQIRFNADRIKWYGAKTPNMGIAVVSIDGGSETSVDCYQPIRMDNTLLYDSGDLTPGEHTLKVRVTGIKNAGSTDTYVSVDRVEGSAPQTA